VKPEFTLRIYGKLKITEKTQKEKGTRPYLI